MIHWGFQPDIEVKNKSRLVTRGDLENGYIRSDSPTADIEAQNLVSVLRLLGKYGSAETTLLMPTFFKERSWTYS